MKKSQPPVKYSRTRRKVEFVFTYLEWAELIQTGKYDFERADLDSAMLEENGFIGWHYGYPCYIAKHNQMRLEGVQ